MRKLNQVLCFIFFILLFYLYVPQSMGQTEPAAEENLNTESTDVVDATSERESDRQRISRRVRERVNERLEATGRDPEDDDIKALVQQEMRAFVDSDEFQGILREEAAFVAKGEARTAVQGELAKVKLLQQQRADIQDVHEKNNRWTMAGGPNRQSLRGHELWKPMKGNGSTGVLVDVRTGMTATSSGDIRSVSAFEAKIAPYLRVEEGGVEMILDLRKDENGQSVHVVQGELREQIQKANPSELYIYIKDPWNVVERWFGEDAEEEVDLFVYFGQVDIPLIRETADSRYHTNRSVLDKVRINSVPAIRLDVGVKQAPTADRSVKEKLIWIQYSAFSIDPDSNSFADFAGRVIISLGLFSDSLTGIQLWGSYGQIRSGGAPSGELDVLVDPALDQAMEVAGIQSDIEKLSGRKLGNLYAEFVRRRWSDGETDQALVVGWERMLPPKEKGGRSREVAVRYQMQQDDRNQLVSDGSSLSAVYFWPYPDSDNLGVRFNVGYIFESSDPRRNKKFIWTLNLEGLF